MPLVRFTIDEELWFQADPDAEGEKAAAESLAARGARIVGAKVFPVAAQRLERLTRNPECHIHDIVKVLETDPGLSAHLLRLVNSAGFGLKVRCTAVRHAAALVGLEKLHQLATTAAVLDLFDSAGAEAGAVIEHANVVAALSRYLAGHLALDGDDLFTCGFLHDIGKLMLLETEGEDYAEMLRVHAGQGDVIHLAERERFGFDHAMLGGHVLRAWRIPEPVPKVVAWHHRVGLAYETSTSTAMVVNTVRLADALSYALVQPEAAREIERLARCDSASYLDISEPQLAAMWDDLSLLMARSRATFRGEVPPASLPRPSGPRASVRPSLGTAVGEPASSSAPAEFDTPRQFPCVVCKKPTFGNACPACRGQVCPEHEVGPERWCRLCADEFREAERNDVLPQTTRVALVVGFAVLAVGSFAGAYGLPGDGIAKFVVTPALTVAFALICVVVGRRASLRVRFLWSRPRRDVAAVDSPFGSSFPTPSIRYGVVANDSDRPDADDGPMIEVGRIVPLSSIPPADDAPSPLTARSLHGLGAALPSQFPSRIPTDRPPPTALVPVPSSVVERHAEDDLPVGASLAPSSADVTRVVAEQAPAVSAASAEAAEGEATDATRPSVATLDRAALDYAEDESAGDLEGDAQAPDPHAGDHEGAAEEPIEAPARSVRVAMVPTHSCVPRASRPAASVRWSEHCTNEGSRGVAAESSTFRVVAAASTG